MTTMREQWANMNFEMITTREIDLCKQNNLVFFAEHKVKLTTLQSTATEDDPFKSEAKH